MGGLMMGGQIQSRSCPTQIPAYQQLTAWGWISISPNKEMKIIPSVFEAVEGAAEYFPSSPNSPDYLYPTPSPIRIQKSPECEWQGVNVECRGLSRSYHFMLYDQIPDPETMALLN